MKKVTAIFLSLILILSLAVTVSASTEYVFDDAGLLTASEIVKLNEKAQQIAEEYGIAVYIMTVYDYRDYGSASGVFDVTWGIYHDRQLGCGPEREGMILLLSMRYRDYATFFYGENTEYAFNSYGQEELEGYFLDDFAEDEWYDGFEDYLSYSKSFLAKAANGKPVRKNNLGQTLIFVAIAWLIALIITLIPYFAMKNAKMKTSAGSYMTGTGLNLTRRSDVFTHQTRSVRVIPKSSGSSSGSRSHSGGGGSGRSGKF